MSSHVIAATKSEFPYPNSVLGLFPIKRVEEKEVVGYYDGSLVYPSLITELQTAKTNEEGVIQITAKEFQKWATKLPVKVMNKDVEEQKAKKVSAPFFGILLTLDTFRETPRGK